MAIDNTSLMTEVAAITTSRTPLPSFQPRAELRANGELIPIIKVMALETRRAYINAYSDVVFLDVVIASGTFAHHVYPYRDDLRVMLYSRPVSMIEQRALEDEELVAQEFRAILHTVDSPVMEGNGSAQNNETELNLTDIRQYRLELIDLTAEQLRAMTVGVALQENLPEDALRYLLTRMSRDVVIDDEQAVHGVNIVPVDNDQPFRQMMIKHGTPVTDLADLFQNTVGLYSTGVGAYIQRNSWYVYPLFDHTRFDQEQRTLTLINVPPRRYKGIERTYRQTANQTIALVAGTVRSADMSNVAMINQGNGTRFADPDRLFRVFGISNADNTALAVREEMVNEIKATDRATGMNHAPLSSQQMTTNKFTQMSMLAARNGTFISIQWDRSNIDAIIPGMPVKFMYEVNQTVAETTGTVLEAIHLTTSTAPGIIQGTYVTQTILLIFVEKTIDWKTLSGD